MGKYIATTADQERAQRLVCDVADAAGMSAADLTVRTAAGVGAAALKLPDGRRGVEIGIEMLTGPRAWAEAVVAHELGHLAHGHRGGIAPLALVSQPALLVASPVLLAGGVTPRLVAFLVLAWTLILIALAHSRAGERRADDFAADLGHAEGLAGFLSRGRGTRPWWRRALVPLQVFATHPAHTSRLRRLRIRAASGGPTIR